MAMSKSLIKTSDGFINLDMAAEILPEINKKGRRYCVSMGTSGREANHRFFYESSKEDPENFKIITEWITRNTLRSRGNTKTLDRDSEGKRPPLIEFINR